MSYVFFFVLHDLKVSFHRVINKYLKQKGKQILFKSKVQLSISLLVKLAKKRSSSVLKGKSLP